MCMQLSTSHTAAAVEATVLTPLLFVTGPKAACTGCGVTEAMAWCFSFEAAFAAIRAPAMKTMGKNGMVVCWC